MGPHPPSLMGGSSRAHVMTMPPHVRKLAAASAAANSSKKTGKKNPVKAVLAGKGFLFAKF